MKLNKDNFELMMFDLLEGNLSEREALDVLKQIEEDEFFFKQWKLFKSTILIADKDVVFEGKDQLLKNEGGAIPLFKWATIAVAASLVIVLFLFLPRTHNNELADKIPTEVIEDPIVPIEQVEVAKSQTPNVDEDMLEEELESDNLIQNPIRVHKQNNSWLEQQVAKVETPQEPRITPVSEKSIVPELKIDIEKPIVPMEMIAIEKPIETFDHMAKDSVYNAIADGTLEPDNKEDKINFKSLVTSSSRKRIRDRAAQIIAAVSNPKVKLKPSFDGHKPGLQIELETTGYQAIASLQPFNKKKK